LLIVSVASVHLASENNNAPLTNFSFANNAQQTNPNFSGETFVEERVVRK
jgi:hypothetical protein